MRMYFRQVANVGCFQVPEQIQLAATARGVVVVEHNALRVPGKETLSFDGRRALGLDLKVLIKRVHHRVAVRVVQPIAE